MGYLEILKKMGLSGEQLTEDEYEKALKYARRKAELNGKDEDYIPLLLPDVIKEWLFSRFTVELMRALAE